MRPEGKILLLANPAAQKGRAADVSYEAADVLRKTLGAGALDIVLSRGPKHAEEIARDLDAHYTTLLVLGGDGAVHEVINGLMARDRKDRPLLGVIPVGSGNDYARTLGMSGDISKAVQQISKFHTSPADVGCCNGEYFAQTLSFGLDAAVALGTVPLREKTNATGAFLYAQSGIDQLLHHLNPHSYRASFGGVEGKEKHRRLSNIVEMKNPEGFSYSDVTVEDSAFTFAVQIGPTYGGGFKICPDAYLADGLFDVCIVHPPASIARAAVVFALAKFGQHLWFRQAELFRCKELTVRFQNDVAVQIDGEPLSADEYHVTIDPRALRVILGN